MQCDRARVLMADALDGVDPPGLDGHLVACPSCAAEWSRLRSVDALLRAGTLAADTPVYDDLVATKADMDARFRVPLKATWMARWL